MGFKSVHFYNGPIEVEFKEMPLFEKKQGCPDSFLWRDRHYEIVELISEWHDLRRKGRLARNMQPKHAERASSRGSWGVGQYYYRVRTDTGQVFDIYYDRTPKGVDDRKGSWFIYRELEEYLA